MTEEKNDTTMLLEFMQSHLALSQKSFDDVFEILGKISQEINQLKQNEN